jgi:YD repeat-containing protein
VRRQQPQPEDPSASTGRGGALLRRLLLCALTSLVGIGAIVDPAAAQKRYDYDALGRLIRLIDEQGRITEYIYDAAGNLVQVVRADAPIVAPIIAAITPGMIRVGQTRQIRLSGTDLIGARVSSPDAGLVVGVISATPTEIVLVVNARADAVVGPKSLTVANSVGPATATLDLRPALVLSTVPGPVVVPPDALARAIVVRLNDAEPEPRIFNLSMLAAGVASVSPATLTVPAGQTEFQVAIAGTQAGRAFFSISSSALNATQTFPVFVAANSAPRAPLLGVYSPPVPPSATVLLPASVTGVAFGATPRQVSPSTVLAGSTVTLTVTGHALENVTDISLNPASGITVTGPIQLSPDGVSASVSLSVAAGTAASAREVIVSGVSGRIEFSDPRGSIVNVVAAP